MMAGFCCCLRAAALLHKPLPRGQSPLPTCSSSRNLSAGCRGGEARGTEMPAQQAGISWSAAGAVHCPSQPGILDRGSCSAQPGATPVWRERGATAAQPGRECDQPANVPKQRRVKRAKTAAHLADAHGTEELAAQPGAATRRHALLNDGNLHIVQAGVGREWAVSGMAAA